MNKKGFTLAEVLISVGIVGVCAAILSPAIVNIMPDKNKTRVLQYYSEISNATVELLNDDSIYYRKLEFEKGEDGEDGIPFVYQEYNDEGELITIGDDPDENPRLFIPEKRTSEDGTVEDNRFARTCEGGLDCTEASNHKTICHNSSGNDKYAKCLSDKVGLSDGKYKDGSIWSISTGSAPYTVSITTPSGEVFAFEVDNWGVVSPGGRKNKKLTEVYLKNVMRVNAKKDKEEAFGSQ